MFPSWIKILKDCICQRFHQGLGLISSRDQEEILFPQCSLAQHCKGFTLSFGQLLAKLSLQMGYRPAMTNQHTFATGLFYYTHQRQNHSYCNNFLIERLLCVLLCFI